MHLSSRLKEVTMEKIPDITSNLIEKLRRLNITSVYQLAVQNPIELTSECEDISLNVESASTLIANARKTLIGNGVLTNEFSTADEVLEKRNKMLRYATAFSFLMPSTLYASGIGEVFNVCLVFPTYPPIQPNGCSSNHLMDLPISV